MATNFPTSLDTLTNPTSTDSLNNPSHSGQHADANDAIEALQAKVGVDSSAITTSLDYRVAQAIADTSLGYISGGYYTTPQTTNTISALTSTLNRVTYQPFFVEQNTTFDRIAVGTSNTFTGSSTIRLGIYNNSNRQPSTVVLDAGTVSCTASGTLYSITISQSLSSGWYWLASVAQSVSGTSSFNSLASPMMFRNGTMASGLSTYVTELWQESSITGAFATAGTLARNSNARMVALRVV